MTDTLTSTPPCSADWLSVLSEEESEDDEEEAVDEEELDDELLLLGSDGDEGWLDDEALGIDGAEGMDGDDEALGIDGADELGDEDDELGIEGMELLELLELEVLWQPASSTARHEAVNSAFREPLVTGVFMFLSSSCPPHASSRCVWIRKVQVFGFTRPSRGPGLLSSDFG